MRLLIARALWWLVEPAHDQAAVLLGKQGNAWHAAKKFSDAERQYKESSRRSADLFERLNQAAANSETADKAVIDYAELMRRGRRTK